jgi:hypothetical protein
MNFKLPYYINHMRIGSNTTDYLGTKNIGT